MTVYNNNANDAQRFFEEFISEFYEKRNYEKCLSVMDENISWFGTGRHEVCHNIADAIRLISAEKESYDSSFSILRQDVYVTPLASSVYAVYSIIHIKDNNTFTLYLNEMETRISTICVHTGDSFIVKHVHVSVPNAEQSEGEFVQKVTDQKYDKLLERTLEERTLLLSNTSLELQALTNNVCGGVEICKCNEALQITYLSEGFTSLTGYTQGLLNKLFNGSHLALVYEKDKASFIEQCHDVIKNGEYNKPYSFEYRIVHKSGAIIWVLDNAIKLKYSVGDRIQCILTDITSHKNQEMALRLSEKRYEIAMEMSDIVMFEYDILSRQLILHERESQLYNVATIVKNGVESFITKGIIEPDSVDGYRGMYDLIHAGAKNASCFIHAKDAMGIIHDYELQLYTVFDDDGRPISAIGLRRNVSNLRRLEKEREFAKTLVSDKRFLFEADVTNNVVINMSSYWKGLLVITVGTPLSDAIDLVCEENIDPAFQDTIRRRTSLQYIEQKYEKGETLIVFSYKRKDEVAEQVWFEGTINIIRDELSGGYHIRFYHANINDRKIKEQRILEDQRLFENMNFRAKLTYEVNITTNSAINGHEDWEQLYGISITESYSEMIASFAVCGIYAEDAQGFIESYEPKRVLEEYAKGVRQIICEYRKPTDCGDLRWVCCTLNLCEDPQTGDIKGFAYVEDIDEHKRSELALKYKADHDTMTGLYNKITTQAAIEAFLSDETYASNQHAFLIIDIDYFKTVNDTFGHMFGDDVLRDVATRIKDIFRENDIVGRVGGDEFAVLMKKVSGKEAVAQKAQEICTQLKITYRKDNASASISASVGIAMFPKNGINYSDLFAYADKALYSTKDGGKNNYAF